MAGNGDIRQKIVLEGEKEYSAALKEAQRNLKVLRSELKAETAELGKNATEQQKNETKTRNLQKQIKEQEKVVRTYEKALKEVREKYGDNEEAIAKWEVKLNDARTALANMKSGLDDTAASMNKVGSAAKSGGEMGIVAMNSLAQSLERVGSVGDSISSSLENAFTGVIGIISGAITDLWADVMEVAGKANGWTDMAAMFGASTTEIQQWENVLKAAGKDFGVLGGMMTRLARGKTDEGIAEWLGVSSENYENELEYTLLVMQRLHEEQQKMSASAFNKKLTENFKGSESDIRWFLANYDTLMGNLDRYDAENGGFGLSEKQIEDMNELYLKVENLKTSWEALKGMAMVELFGDLSLQITGNIQNIVDAFKEYFDATDDAGREAALKKVRENIEQMFVAIKEAIEEGIKMLGQLADELQKSEDPAVRAFGSLLEKIVKVLEWFSDESNWDTVKRGFEALIGVWAAGKIGKAVANIASFASHVKTIIGGGKDLFNLGGSGPSGGTDGGTTGGTDGTGGTVSKIAGKSSWAKDAFKTVASLAIPLAIGYEVTAGYQQSIDAWNADAERRKGEFARQEKSFTEESDPLMVDAWKYIQEHANDTGFLDDLAERYYKWYKSANVTSEYYGYEDPLWDAIQQAYDNDFISPETYRALVGSGEDLQGGLMGVVNRKRWMGGNGETIDLMETMDLLNQLEAGLAAAANNPNYVPADSWNGANGEGIKTELSEAAVAAIGTSVKGAVSGIKVIMDGVSVGHLVAPTVSQDIARETAVP